MSSQRPIIGFTAELERQAWDDEGREKDRQKALSGASEGDGVALADLEGLSSAGVSATANLQGVTSRFDWYLDRVVHLERSGTLTVNHDVVRATSDLDSDCFMRHLQGCCHLRSPLSVGRATAPSSSPERVSAHRQSRTHRGIRTFPRIAVVGSAARRPPESKPLPGDIWILLRPEGPAHPNLTRVGGLVVPGCGSDCTFRVLGIADSGTSKTNQPEWVVPGS